MSYDIYDPGDWFKQLYPNMSAHMPLWWGEVRMADQVPSRSEKSYIQIKKINKCLFSITCTETVQSHCGKKKTSAMM